MKSSHEIRDILAGVLCLSTLALSVYFREDASVVVALSFLMVFIVGVFSTPLRHILPILFLVFLIKILALPIAYILGELDPFTYYLASAFVDLLMAFCIVFYHNDPVFFRLFKVNEAKFVPQVYLMAIVLAISSIVSCVQSMEALMFVLDNTFYDNGPPLVSSHQSEIKQVIKLLFDLTIWSLLLDPNRWKILQKIQNKFLAP